MGYKKSILLFFLVFFLTLSAIAQRLEVGIAAGGAGYMGDLNQYNPIKISGITAGAFARLNFTPRIGLAAHYNYGVIKADDSKSSYQDYINRNLNFKTTLHEFTLIGNINFLDIYSPISKRRFTPHIFAGFGGVIFTPKGKYNNLENKLRDLKTEGQLNPYRDYAIVVPYGAGAKYRLTDYVTIFSEIGYRTTFTDYLDDVSGNYFYPSYVTSTPVEFPPYNASKVPGFGIAGTQRGDFRKRDTYMFVSIGISYNFVSQKCFTF